MRSSMASEDSGSSVLVKVRNATIQGQKFLCPSWFLEAQLTSLLLPGRAMRLFNQIVAARRGNNLELLHSVEQRKRSNGRPVTPQLIGVNDIWDLVVHQQPFEKVFGCLRVAVRLQQDVQHCASFHRRPATTNVFLPLISTYT